MTDVWFSTETRTIGITTTTTLNSRQCLSLTPSLEVTHHIHMYLADSICLLDTITLTSHQDHQFIGTQQPPPCGQIITVLKARRECTDLSSLHRWFLKTCTNRLTCRIQPLPIVPSTAGAQVILCLVHTCSHKRQHRRSIDSSSHMGPEGDLRQKASAITWSAKRNGPHSRESATRRERKHGVLVKRVLQYRGQSIKE